jgi:uncharacterized protein
MDVLAAVGIGLAAGMVAGMLGVGGGILFVPALTIALGLGQVEAEATSLLAMVPVAIVGSWCQHRYGNVNLRDAVTLGVLAVGGAVGGVAIANAVSESALEKGFAALLLFSAAQLVRGALGDRASAPMP